MKLLIDNMTAVAYIDKKGGTRSPQLATLAVELWTYCLSRQIWVTAKHLPGLMNSEADHASRNFNTHTEWKLNPEIFQRITTRYYTPEVDLFASRLNHQLPLYVRRYPDPGAIAIDAFLQDWSLWTVFIHPPIVLIPRILLQMKHDKATGLLIAPNWQGQPWFSDLSVNHSSSVCSRRNSPTVEDPSSSGMASFRSRIEAAGIPEDVCQIIMASWRGSSQQRYKGPWKLWSSWCIQRQKCPFSAPVNDILPFPAEQFNNRCLAHRTIAVYKACISQLHDPIEGRQVGKLPLVSRFMKGKFELRPPQPKLCSIWPLSKVLSHFAELEPLDSLSLKGLTLKLIILLALTSAARAHELAALNLASALIKPESYEFGVPIHVKNARPNHPPRKILFTKYNENSAICVVKCLNHYLTRTKDLRKGNKLLISYVKPHQEVGSQTVSRWLCAAIQQAGVEMPFTGHSTRAAATSEAADSGIPLELVLEAADWSSAGTFEKHYHKQTSSRGKFAKSVLGSLKN